MWAGRGGAYGVVNSGGGQSQKLQEPETTAAGNYSSRELTVLAFRNDTPSRSRMRPAKGWRINNSRCWLCELSVMFAERTTTIRQLLIGPS